MIDNLLMFSDGQTPTTSGTTTASTNVIDTSVALRQIGDGKRVELSVPCTVTATSGGSATVQVVLQDSADNASWSTVLTGKSYAVASVVAGLDLLPITLPAGLRRYLRVGYTIGTADLTAGTFSAYLVIDRQQATARASGFTIY